MIETMQWAADRPDLSIDEVEAKEKAIEQAEERTEEQTDMYNNLEMSSRPDHTGSVFSVCSTQSIRCHQSILGKQCREMTPPRCPPMTTAMLGRK